MILPDKAEKVLGVQNRARIVLNVTAGGRLSVGRPKTWYGCFPTASASSSCRRPPAPATSESSDGLRVHPADRPRGFCSCCCRRICRSRRAPFCRSRIATIGTGVGKRPTRIANISQRRCIRSFRNIAGAIQCSDRRRRRIQLPKCVRPRYPKVAVLPCTGRVSPPSSPAGHNSADINPVAVFRAVRIEISST